MEEASLKLRTARTLKWNVIDRVSSQVLYAVTGIVLANVLTEEDFGLVGAVLVFQAFASLFVDSGFSSALIQCKNPTHKDYSTVLWFNIGMATLLYAALYVAAPLIATWFQDDERLIPLSRVMFLSFIINATAIVQTNRLMKQMDVKMIAVSNCIGLMISAVVGIYLAVTGYGAWAIVWQTLTLNAVKSIILWTTSHWLPMATFSWESLRRFLSVGMGVAATSLLNTIFLNIYSFLIGNRLGLVKLGYYTQADKWSKMGITSLTQILTSSFLPVLSQAQDDRERFVRMMQKMNRFTAYILFPAIGLLIVMATPIFHLLFGEKWDPSIVLFQILLARGVFMVLTSLYNNYILALGRAKLLVKLEVVKDVVALVAIGITLPFMATTEGGITAGVEILLWGQLGASALTYVVTLMTTARVTQSQWWGFVSDCLPYAAITIVATMPAMVLSAAIDTNWVLLATQCAVGVGLYFAINHALGGKIQRDAIDYIAYRFKNKNKAK